MWAHLSLVHGWCGAHERANLAHTNNGFICNAVPEDSTCTAQQHHSCFRHRLTDWLAEWLLQQVGSRRAVGSTPDEKRDNGSESLIKRETNGGGAAKFVELHLILICVLSHAMQLCTSESKKFKIVIFPDFSITKAPNRNCFGYLDHEIWDMDEIVYNN